MTDEPNELIQELAEAVGLDPEVLRAQAEQIALEAARPQPEPPPRPTLELSPDAELLVGAVLAIEYPWNLTLAERRARPEVQAILAADPELRRECVLGVALRERSVSVLLPVVARRSVPLTIADVELLVAAGPYEGYRPGHDDVLRSMTPHFKALYERSDADGRAALAPLLERAARLCHYRQDVARLRAIAADADDPIELMDDRDDVGPRIKAALRETVESPDAVRAFAALLVAYPPNGKPSKRWFGEAADARAALSAPGELVRSVVRAALDAEIVEVEHQSTGHWFAPGLLAGHNERYLCGAVVFAGTLGDPALLPDLRSLAARTIAPTAMPHSLRVANACAAAIAQIGGPAAIGELLALERTTRHGTLQREIRKAIDALAAAQSMSRGELLERAVERHGLEPDGTASVPLSTGSALLRVEDTTVTLAYVDAGGTTRKSFPAKVKEADAESLADLRERVKAIRKTIASERVRLDALIAEGRSWALSDWAGFYLDHPITARLARLLIWRFGDLVAMPLDATTAVTPGGATHAIPRDATVELWHPIRATPDEIAAWRAHLLATETVQPIKQAYRELYSLTPAEETSRVYSNRFAGHVFRQVQAKSLMKKRGWQPVAVAWFDDGIDHGVARRTFADAGVRAELFWDPILDVDPDTTDLYPYCTSDQVRFFAAETDVVIELPDVPPLVFTEAMRDVDLFVGVTSVGADPLWLDRREGRRFEIYWNEFGFGPLRPAGEIRREVLAELLPKLTIADRCELHDRWLTVRGNLRTYRIHLGSGNILMSPDDRYLCIVPSRDPKAGAVFLPFDDDATLSVVLAKAFLLAADDEIDDPTIAEQIR